MPDTPSREYVALGRALRDVMALAQEHDADGSRDSLRNAAMDMWHDVMSMGWQEQMPPELTDAAERADHVGRSSFVMGVLVGTRLRDAG